MDDLRMFDPSKVRAIVEGLERENSDLRARLSAYTAPVGEKAVEEALADAFWDSSKTERRCLEVHKFILGKALLQTRAALVENREALAVEFEKDSSVYKTMKKDRDLALSRLASANRVVGKSREAVRQHGQCGWECVWCDVSDALAVHDANKGEGE